MNSIEIFAEQLKKNLERMCENRQIDKKTKSLIQDMITLEKIEFMVPNAE